MKPGSGRPVTLLAFICGALLLPPSDLVCGQTCDNGGGGSGSGGVNGDPGCFVEYKIAGAGWSKCHFQEFVPTQPPRIQIYAEQTTKLNYTYTFSSSHTGEESNPNCEVIADGTAREWASETHNQTQWSLYDKLTCVCSNSYSGQNTSDSGMEDTRTWSCNNPYPATGDIKDYQYSDYATSDSAQLVTVNASPTWCWVGSIQTSNASHCVSCPGGCGNDCWGISSSTIGYSNTINGLFSFSYTNTLTQPTEQDFQITSTTDPSGGQYSGTVTVNLSDLYTDGDLYNTIMSKMPNYPTDWSMPDDILSRCAFSLIDETHVWAWGQPAQLQKMVYQFGVTGTQPNITYRISWDLITWDISTGQVSVNSQSATVVGTGDPLNPVYVGAFEVLPPQWDSSNYGGYVITWVDNVSVGAVSGPSVPVAGAGPYPSGSASGCASCGSSGASLVAGRTAGAVSLAFSLGNDIGGPPAGQLRVWSDQPTSALATPALLSCSSNSANVQVIQVANQIRQVNAPQGLADVVTDDPFTYEIRYYLESQAGSQVNGLYQPSGSPYVTWKIQNPNASTNICNRLQVTETRGSQVNTYSYTFFGASNSWLVDYPGALREDQVVTTFTTNSDQTYTRVVTTTTRVPGGSNISKVARVYQQVGHGNPFPTNLAGANIDAGSELLVQEIRSPDTNPQITTYSYYNNYVGGVDPVPNGTYRPVKLVVHPDGSWQYYDYTTFWAYGRYLPVVSAIYSGLGDVPPPASGAFPDSSTCRYESFIYGSQSTADDGSQFPLVPRTDTVTVRGALVSQRYVVFPPGERDDVRCPNAGAGLGDPSTLATVTKYYTTGPNASRVMSVQNPDGTMATYAYAQGADGSQTNTVCTGAVNSSGVVIDGTSDVTILGPVGQMISHTVSDIASGVTLTQDNYNNYDSFSRPQQVTHLDGTTESTQYGCCEVDSTTDRDGVVTTFGYDAMKRQVSTTRLGITTTNVLDPAGRAVQTIRTGSDNSQMTLSQSAFDLAGRLIAEANALGGVTQYSESNDPTTGGLVRTATYPDGGTRVESYYVDGSLKQVSGTAVHPVQYIYGFDGNSPVTPYTIEAKIASDGTTNEWVKTCSDGIGRPTWTLYPDGSGNTNFYNGFGQLQEEIDPDGVTTHYKYNAKGELEYTAVDLNQNGQIDFSGPDRITETERSVVPAAGGKPALTRTDTLMFLDGQSTGTLLSRSEVSADGLQSWQATWQNTSTPVVTHSQTSYGTGGSRTVRLTAPDNSSTVSTYSFGQLVTVARNDSQGHQISGMTYSYDAHGRQAAVTDARNGATTDSYNNADLVASLTTPSPGNGGPAQTTSNFYNLMLQTTNVVNPDGTSVTNSYYLTGELKQTSGSRTYPVAYSYDYGGRMKTMTNWSGFSAGTGARVTTWNYDPRRGWLSSKQYPDGTGPSYTYTSAGRLLTRTWARLVSGQPLVTTYSYDTAGGLSTISYSDTTPGVTYSYDRLGRQTSIVQNGITTALAYNLAGQALGESYSGGALSGLSVTNGYDQFLRRTVLDAQSSSASLLQQSFAYDAASRLQKVSDGNNNSATYSYLANSSLVGQIVYTNGSALRMTTTRQFDNLNRLTSVLSSGGFRPTPVSFNYLYNNANQRTTSLLADGTYWLYQYDSLGQVISGRKYWNDGTPVAGEQFGYSFDTIGNRTQTQAGGDQNGANLRVANYSANTLNQYTSRDVPGALDVLGLSYSTDTVTVNGQTAYRKGEFFRQQLSVTNSSAPVWQPVTVSAIGFGSVSGNVYVAQEPEQFTYDADGNLASDGRWNYTWDAENRLIAMTNISTVPTAAKMALTFAYDWQGRRIEKRVFTWTSGSWLLTSDFFFLYDDWNLIAALNPRFSVVNSFMWGSDLSGSPQGAGGVGGLLEVSYKGAATTNCFVAFDGNGNIAGLVNAGDGSTAAAYEYGPFGEVLRATDPMAKANPLRFSTKYQDDESDLLYYGYRYSSASTGRWINRDPAEEEQGGPNLYDFANNMPTAVNDLWGLSPCGPVDGGGGGGGVTLACGVEKMLFKPLFWTTGEPGEAAMWNVLLIKFTQDASHNPTACAIVAQTQVSSVVDGKKVEAGGGGVPYDNQWHTDTTPWSKDADFYLQFPPSQLRGSLYENKKNDAQAANLLGRFGLKASDWDYVAFDRPGWGPGKLRTGNQISRRWSQRAIVFDQNRKTIVKQEDCGPGAPFMIVGTYPDLRFSPRLNK